MKLPSNNIPKNILNSSGCIREFPKMAIVESMSNWISTMSCNFHVESKQVSNNDNDKVAHHNQSQLTIIACLSWSKSSGTIFIFKQFNEITPEEEKQSWMHWISSVMK